VCRLEDVMKNYIADFGERMSLIQHKLGESTSQDASDEQVHAGEKLLEELMEIVESIDFARDLRSIGGLPVLKALMQCTHISLRWRAADVVATCCQNFSAVQVCSAHRSWAVFCISVHVLQASEQ
jgi:hsp70-interacting protein